jgi:hypothetical protein
MIALANPAKMPSIKSVASLAMVGIVIFVGYRTLVRDVFSSTSDETFASAFTHNLTNLPEFLLAGDEASAFDYLVVTRMEVPEAVPHRGMELVPVVLQAPIPRALVPGSKPERSGAVLTRELRPELYARGGNVAFSGAADLYFAFGDVAIPLGFAAFGALAGFVLRLPDYYAKRGPASRLWAAAFGFLAASALLSVFRADLFELGLLPVRLVLPILVWHWFITNQAAVARPSE